MKRVKVLWMERATNDLLKIYDYIYGNSPKNAKYIVEKLFQKVVQLESFPEIGTIEKQLKHKGKYRFLVEYNYKIIYSFRNNIVKILTIYDTRQDPNKLTKSVN